MGPFGGLHAGAEGLLAGRSGGGEGSQAADADLAVQLAEVVAGGEQEPLVAGGVVAAEQ